MFYMKPDFKKWTPHPFPHQKIQGVSYPLERSSLHLYFTRVKRKPRYELAKCLCYMVLATYFSLDT